MNDQGNDRMNELARAVMSTAQLGAADKALAEESAKRHHLVVYLSGSHAYGFPSPDSDLDLKAIHIAPTTQLVGLHGATLHRDRLEVIDGIEVDYTSNELGAVLRGVLSGNGNYIERILGTLYLSTTAEHQALIPITRACLSRKVFRHYAGFATSQRKAVDKSTTPRAKSVLYVLRTALTGIHLLDTGELITDVRELLDDHGLGEARQLITIKQSGERTELDEDAAVYWRGKLDQVMDSLRAARARSCLPEQPENVAALEQWLLEVRRGHW